MKRRLAGTMAAPPGQPPRPLSWVHYTSPLQIPAVSADTWGMDQRRETRLAARRHVAVTFLQDRATRVTAWVRDICGRGMALESPLPAAPGTALKIEIDDGILLGEVIYCRAENGCYWMGVELDQMLVGLSELADALREFGGQASRAEGPDPAQDRDEQDREQPHEQ